MIKKLAKCIGEYKKETILTPIFVAFECAFDVIIPFLIAGLIGLGLKVVTNICFINGIISS